MAKKGQPACPKIFRALAVDLCPRRLDGKNTPDSEGFQPIQGKLAGWAERLASPVGMT